jgi:hypothetical protein
MQKNIVYPMLMVLSAHIPDSSSFPSSHYVGVNVRDLKEEKRFTYRP